MTHDTVCALAEFDHLMAESHRAPVDADDATQHVKAGAGP